MNKEELEKRYKQIYELKDGNYMVSTKSPNEITEVCYFAHTNIDEVYGMEGKWGLVDKNGNVIIEPKYIYPFIECGDNYQVMLPNEYKEIESKEKIVLLKHGLINKKGNVIIPIKYINMEAMDSTGTYFRVADNKTYKAGVIDKNNNVIVPFEYDFLVASPDLELMVENEFCSTYPDNIYQVKVVNNDLYGVYDLKLKKEIIKPEYKYLKIIGYNRFLIGKSYDDCNTLINEKKQIVEV